MISISALRSRTVLSFLCCAFGIACVGQPLFAAEIDLPAPTILSITKGEGDDSDIHVVGRAQGSLAVDVEIVSLQEGPVFRDSANTNAGEWTMTIPASSFPLGAYLLRAVARDAAGRTSPAVQARGFKVKPTSLISVQGVEFGFLDVLVIGSLLAIAVVGLAGWFHEHEKRKREAVIAATQMHSSPQDTFLEQQIQQIRSELSSLRLNSNTAHGNSS